MFFRRPKKTVSATATIENDLPDEHRKIVEQVRFATMTSDERLIALCQAIKYVCSAKIEGDIVECGVWKGGSMMAAAHSLQQYRTRLPQNLAVRYILWHVRTNLG